MGIYFSQIYFTSIFHSFIRFEIELSCFSLLDTALLPTATKPKTLQTEEVTATGSNHNVTANPSQDREFILFENEHIALYLLFCTISISQLCCTAQCFIIHYKR